VAVRAPFSLLRPSFLGKEPGTLEGLCGRTFDSMALARAIADAYVAAAGGASHELAMRKALPESVPDAGLRAERAWTSCVEEVIGPVCAGPDAAGVLRLGGDFMASRDAVAKVEAGVASLGAGATLSDVGRLVNDAFTTADAAIEGVKDLASVRDALWGAQKRT